ncbi:MAG: Co2+/Mg2+ efflux protein ApaG [Gammaproteobacteria bacterium]|nr:MAG: Co2+/Mg2+ efflux protein ApaG [Gammaproteobacteria bacterium]
MNVTDTPEIAIEVETRYVEDQSQPGADRYVFAYTITISNTGKAPARLLNRHWVITDANGKVQEVRGEGVVGEQPHIQPGEYFQYTSGAVIETPVGTMEGEYEMITDDGRTFLAPIPRFTLSIPRTLH